MVSIDIPIGEYIIHLTGHIESTGRGLTITESMDHTSVTSFTIRTIHRKLAITQENLDDGSFTVGQGLRIASVSSRERGLLPATVFSNSDSKYEAWAIGSQLDESDRDARRRGFLIVELFRRANSDDNTLGFNFNAFSTDLTQVQVDSVLKSLASKYYIDNSMSNTRETVEV